MDRDGRSNSATADRRAHGRLYLHVAGWPGRCVDCQDLVRKGEPMVFRHGLDARIRWCMDCSAMLVGEISPTRAYLRAFGDDDRLAALRATAGTGALREETGASRC